MNNDNLPSCLDPIVASHQVMRERLHQYRKREVTYDKYVCYTVPNTTATLHSQSRYRTSSLLTLGFNINQFPSFLYHLSLPAAHGFDYPLCIRSQHCFSLHAF